MEDTMTISSQSFWRNKYSILTVSLASAFSANAMAQNLEEFPTVNSCITIQTDLISTKSLGTDKTYSFPTKKSFRERYKRIARSEWFRKTHLGMSVGEIMTIEE